MADEKDIKANEQSNKNIEDSMSNQADSAKTINQLMKEVGQAMVNMEVIMRDVTKVISKGAKSASQFQTEYSVAADLAKGFQKDAKDAYNISQKVARGEKLSNAERKKALVLKDRIAKKDFLKQDMLEKYNYAQKIGDEAAAKGALVVLQRIEDIGEHSQEVVKAFDDIEESLDEIDNKASVFDFLSEITGAIPGVSKVLGEFKAASEAARKAAAEGGNSFLAGGKKLAGAAGKAAGAFAVTQFVKGIGKGQERVTSFSRELNISRDAAQELNNQFVDAATESAFKTKELISYQTNLANTLGTVVDFSKENANQFALMEQRLGLSGEEATKLTKLTAISGKSLKDQNESIVANVMSQNIANKSAIRYQDVMKDIAGASATQVLSMNRLPGGIAKAAFEARRLGMSFSQLEGASSNLLDMESSIANEMEAELLLGRDLNLDKARMAALTGDQATLAQELAKNLGTAEEFGNMNRIQQEALAKAMGMSREEVAQTLIDQEALAKLGGDQSKSLQERVKERQAEIDKMEEGAEKQKAQARLMQDIAGTELERQMKNKSLSEKREKMMDDLSNVASKLATAFDFIGKAFSFVSENATAVLATLGAIGGLSLFGKFRSLIKIFSKLKGGASGLMNILKGGSAASKTAKAAKSASKAGAGAIMKGTGKMVYGAAAESAVKAGTASVAKTAGKIGGKALGKSLIKKIPIVGALAGVGFALSRAAKGDWTGAALELASGGASLLPGLGTAASVAIDAGLAARDISQSKSRSADQTMEVSDFTIKPLDKDTITMAGGTKLGGNVEALLQELINEVKKGKGVTLDGYKVGEVLSLSSGTL